MKKVLALILVLAMALSLCACGSKGGEATNDAAGGSELAGTYKITVWVPDAAVELTKTQIANFNSSNENGIVIEATVEAVSEADAGTNMITDVEAGGDIYFFAQDQFARLVQAGALAKLGVSAAEAVTAANDAGVVAAATTGTDMYAYPLTSDNGYFMYYDKSVISEDIVDSLEDIIAACEGAGKNFSMELDTSAWYLASFFFGVGCHSNWVTDSDGKFISADDDFNSANGLIAAKGIQKLITSNCHVSSSSASDFDANSAVVVTGQWDFETAKAILGDNMGCTDLPSFTVDGTQYHIGSFNGCKLLGVKPQTDAVKAAALHKLAQYLTSEECQMERYTELSWGPANSAAQASDAVQANPGLAALFLQNAYSVPQGQIHGSWWDLAKVIGTDIKAAATEDDLKAALESYEAKIQGLFTMDESVANAFTVIGSINGDGWSVDLAMTEDNGVWTTDEAYAMDAGVEFKVRQGLSWDNAFPADNFVVETAGTYYVQFNAATEEVSLVPAE